MKKEKAFILIELLVVVAVLALLGSIILVSTRGTKEVAKHSRATVVATHNQHLVCGQGQMMDLDGNFYDTVEIGGLCWMAENLRYLPSVSPSTANSTTELTYHVYGYTGTNIAEAKATTNFQTYGVLYNWPAAMTACPFGTRLPTDEEFHILERTFATGTCDPNRAWLNENWTCDPAGMALKAVFPAWDGNNSSGFSAIPAGGRDSYYGNFSDLTVRTEFWSSSESSATAAWKRSLVSGHSTVARWEGDKGFGFSVRCVKGEVDERRVNVATHNRLLVCGQDQMIDNDGNRYDTVEIGGLCWMAENLRYLPSVSPSAVHSIVAPTYHVYDYQGIDVNAAKAHPNFQTRGVLYNWPAAMTACPSGTRLPTDEEFHVLERAFITAGSSCNPNRDHVWDCDSAGTALKAASPAWNGTNFSGFSALPAGFRCTSGDFYPLTWGTWFWSSSESGINAWHRSLHSESSSVYRETRYKGDGFSVRCVKRGADEREVNVATHNRLLVCGQDQMIDNDGNRYDTVEIGGLCWMAENLRYLPSVSQRRDGSITELRHYVYGYDGTDINVAKYTTSFQKYGVLYNWPAAMAACPFGTRLPTDEEFHVLERTFAIPSPIDSCNSTRGWPDKWGCDPAGTALKAAFPAWDGDNSSGFSAIPAGGRHTDGSFIYPTMWAYFWSSSGFGTSAWSRHLHSGFSTVHRWAHNKGDGLSVRCVR